MDQIKIGRFVAETRRAKGLTQLALGEALGPAGLGDEAAGLDLIHGGTSFLA